MKKMSLLLIASFLISCGKKENSAERKIENDHVFVDVEMVGSSMAHLENRKIQVLGFLNVAGTDACLMDINSSACLYVDNNFFNNYSAFTGVQLYLYGILTRHPVYAYPMIKVYYYKDMSNSIKKVIGREY